MFLKPVFVSFVELTTHFMVKILSDVYPRPHFIYPHSIHPPFPPPTQTFDLDEETEFSPSTSMGRTHRSFASLVVSTLGAAIAFAGVSGGRYFECRSI